MDLYTAIWQIECTSCGSTPVVGLRTPSGMLASTGICGPHFFGDRTMVDPDLWNNQKEASE